MGEGVCLIFHYVYCISCFFCVTLNRQDLLHLHLVRFLSHPPYPSLPDQSCFTPCPFKVPSGLDVVVSVDGHKGLLVPSRRGRGDGRWWGWRVVLVLGTSPHHGRRPPRSKRLFRSGRPLGLDSLFLLNFPTSSVIRSYQEVPDHPDLPLSPFLLFSSYLTSVVSTFFFLRLVVPSPS